MFYYDITNGGYFLSSDMKCVDPWSNKIFMIFMILYHNSQKG